MFKKAIEKNGVPSKTKEYLEQVNKNTEISSNGIFHDSLYEPIPKYINSNSEEVSSKGNSWIVLGRDRPGSRLSGYGAKGDTQAYSIDIVVGRMGSKVKKVNENGEQLHCDPNFFTDAARIYVSQKTDIDLNFGIVPGKVGNPKARSAIGMKADSIRVIGREGIKLVTGTDKENSMGGKLYSVSGIDLIAGNVGEELQPMTRGNNVQGAIEKIVKYLDDLSGIVDGLLHSQNTFNEVLTNHFHISPYFAQPDLPSEHVVLYGNKVQLEFLTKIKRSILDYKINLGNFRSAYLAPYGKNYILSRYNNNN